MLNHRIRCICGAGNRRFFFQVCKSALLSESLIVVCRIGMSQSPSRFDVSSVNGIYQRVSRLTSPFIVALLCSVSRVLRFLPVLVLLL